MYIYIIIVYYLPSFHTIIQSTYMSCSKKGFKGKIMPIILSVSKKLVRILLHMQMTGNQQCHSPFKFNT